MMSLPPARTAATHLRRAAALLLAMLVAGAAWAQGQRAVFSGFHVMTICFQSDGRGEANRLFVVNDKNVHAGSWV